MGLRRWLGRLFGREDDDDETPALAPPGRQARPAQQRLPAQPGPTPDGPCGVVVVEAGYDEPEPAKPVQWRTVQVASGVRRVQPSAQRERPPAPVRPKRAPPPSVLGNPWSNASVEDGRARGYERRTIDHD